MSKYFLYENDYSSDSLRWIRLLDEKDIKYNPHTNTYNITALEKFQNEIIKNNDAALAYFFTTEFNYKPYRMQKVILDSKEPKYAYLFAKNIKNSDIKALQNVVIKSEQMKYICKFACFVEGADQKILQKIILKSKNVKYAHMLLKHTNLNVNKIKSLIIESKKPRYLFELAKHIKSKKELSKIEDLIIESNSFTYIRVFAEKIKNCNVEKLEQAILDSNNQEEIEKFAKYVRKSQMRRFLIL